MLVQKLQSPSIRRTLIASILFLVWAVGVNGVIGSLMLGHLVSLPAATGPAGPKDFQRSSDEGWTVFHVLVNDCPCSESVSEHLVARGPLAGVTERIVFCGESNEGEHESLPGGFLTTAATAESLEEAFGVSGGPWMVVVAPDGSIAYSGGHSTGRDPVSRQYMDQTIVVELMEGREVAPLAAYGCAISDEWRQAVDPLGIKYRLRLQAF